MYVKLQCSLFEYLYFDEWYRRLSNRFYFLSVLFSFFSFLAFGVPDAQDVLFASTPHKLRGFSLQSLTQLLRSLTSVLVIISALQIYVRKYATPDTAMSFGINRFAIYSACDIGTLSAVRTWHSFVRFWTKSNKLYFMLNLTKINQNYELLNDDENKKKLSLN